LRVVVGMAIVALLLGSEIWPGSKPHAPLVGFSYSPLTSLAAHRDPVKDLEILLDDTKPDLVRLPIYWESVAPSPGTLDFSSIDELLEVVDAHNRMTDRSTRVVLVVGARNLLYPELHIPEWAGPRQQPQLNEVQSGAAYREYFDDTVIHYRSSSLLFAWQVENEPLDYVGNASTGDDQITAAQLAWEIAEAHRLDPEHKVVITSYDGWNVDVDMLQLYAPSILAALGGYPSGHPGEALAAGDALGLDLYVDSPYTQPLFANPDLRSAWKQQAVDFWAWQARADGKELWVAEMQAQPWNDATTYSPADLVAGAEDYRVEPLQVVLLWGVETWLQDPKWMAGAEQAMAILRS
jgi:hypothetical protein